MELEKVETPPEKKTGKSSMYLELVEALAQVGPGWYDVTKFNKGSINHFQTYLKSRGFRVTSRGYRTYVWIPEA